MQNMHIACGRQGDNGMTGVKGVQDRGTDWTRTIFSFFFFFLNFSPLLLHVRIQSTDNGIGRVSEWMVVRGFCFGRRSAAVGGPRWSLPSFLAFPEHPSRRADRAVPSGPILLSRPGALRAVHKMRWHDAYERDVGSLARTHARTRTESRGVSGIDCHPAR